MLVQGSHIDANRPIGAKRDCLTTDPHQSVQPRRLGVIAELPAGPFCPLGCCKHFFFFIQLCCPLIPVYLQRGSISLFKSFQHSYKPANHLDHPQWTPPSPWCPAPWAKPSTLISPVYLQTQSTMMEHRL